MAEFTPSKTAEKKLETQLRKVARAVSSIITPHVRGATLINAATMMEQLRLYAEMLGPWAEVVTGQILETLTRVNRREWSSLSQQISRQFREDAQGGALMQAVRLLQREQVGLITSIPIQAGERAQELALQAVTGGKRADEVAAELLRTEQVTASRAMLIARTEIAKANEAITQARAESVGSEGYIWRTAKDKDVRDSHDDMEGVYVRWNSPPTLSDGTVGHAGTFPNCRCYTEPVIPGYRDE